MEKRRVVTMTNREVYENMCDELEQYHAIGTVKECREAREKQIPKKPIKDKWKHDCCPSCGWFVSEETGWGDRYNPHCENCGQAIQWDN